MTCRLPLWTHGWVESRLFFFPVWPCPSSLPALASSRGHRHPPSLSSVSQTQISAIRSQRFQGAQLPWGHGVTWGIVMSSLATRLSPAGSVPGFSHPQASTAQGLDGRRVGSQWGGGPSLCRALSLSSSCLSGFQEGLSCYELGRELCDQGATSLLETPSANWSQATGRLGLQTSS